MKKLWWRIRLFVLLTWYRYTWKRWYNFVQTWKFTGSDCWIDYFNDGYNPIEALKEDWSYADVEGGEE